MQSCDLVGEMKVIDTAPTMRMNFTNVDGLRVPSSVDPPCMMTAGHLIFSRFQRAWDSIPRATVSGGIEVWD